MSIQAERIEAAANAVLELLLDDGEKFTGQEIMAILDAARFAVMTSEMKDDHLGADFVAESGGEPTPEEIQRWEDDGGAVL